MIPYHIKDLKEAERLTQVCNCFDFDIDLNYSTQTVNAKSLLCVTSLVGNIVSVIPRTEDLNAIETLMSALDIPDYEATYRIEN